MINKQEIAFISRCRNRNVNEVTSTEKCLMKTPLDQSTKVLFFLLNEMIKVFQVFVASFSVCTIERDVNRISIFFQKTKLRRFVTINSFPVGISSFDE